MGAIGLYLCEIWSNVCSCNGTVRRAARAAAIATALLGLASGLIPTAGAASSESHSGHAASAEPQAGSAAPAETHAGHGSALDLNFDVGYMFDDNVARGKWASDKFSDQVYSVNVSKTEVFPINDNARMLLTGRLGGEKFNRYTKLNRISGEVNAEFQYRGSGAFSAPTFAMFGRFIRDEYESALRSGTRNSVGVSVRQPITDRIQLFGALAHSERYGKSSVFINRNNSAKLDIDYVLTRQSTIYFGAEYRSGDIVSGTRTPRLEDIDVAKVLVQDDAYSGGQFFSYRFDGSTVISTLGYNLGFSPDDSLDLSWRRVESTPSFRPSFATSPRSYIVNQFSLVYLKRF